MAQFDVFANPYSESRATFPFLLDIQNDLLAPLATRVVVPLVRAEAVNKPIKNLNPSFEIAGLTVLMSTAELAGISQRALGEKITSLATHRDSILAALDFLITGF